jgi:inhibitor of KinA sporulation pathway (predicted exonuclease)
MTGMPSRTVIVDTEYTTWEGALESGWAGEGQHREIVQVAAIAVDASFRETAKLDILVRPAINGALSPLFVKLTGIGQTKVDAEGVTFADALYAFHRFAGTDPIVCMNADEAVFRENCELSEMVFPFPSSWHRLRPFLENRGVDLTAMSSGDLHRLTANPLQGHVHNALHDVRSMAHWLAETASGGGISSIDELPTGAPSFDPRSDPSGRPAV